MILEEEIPDFSPENQSPGTVEVISYQPNEIKVKTNSESNKILFFSDNFFPGWQALVDGQEKKIYRANYSFRAVPIPTGEHQVILSYKPKPLERGAIVSGLALAGFLLLSFWVCRKECR